MNSTFLIGNNLPEQTNVIIGTASISGNTLASFNKNYDELSIEQKTLHQELIGIIGLNATVNIINCPSYFDCSIIVPDNTNLDILDLDYATMSQQEQNTIDGFYDMIVSFCI